MMPHRDLIQRTPLRARRTSTAFTNPEVAPAPTAAAAASSTGVGAPAASAALPLGLATKRLKAVRAWYETWLGSVMQPTASARLLAGLPTDLHTQHALIVQRQSEKVLANLRRNCLEECEIVLSEHRLPEKLAELEYLEKQGGIVLDASLGLAPAPTPEQAVRNMVQAAREAECARLEALADEIEQENKQLRTDVKEASESLTSSRVNVTRKQQHTDQLYDLLEREARQ